jgi:hypothetical protein
LRVERERHVIEQACNTTARRATERARVHGRGTSLEALESGTCLTIRMDPGDKPHVGIDGVTLHTVTS